MYEAICFSFYVSAGLFFFFPKVSRVRAVYACPLLTTVCSTEQTLRHLIKSH